MQINQKENTAGVAFPFPEECHPGPHAKFLQTSFMLFATTAWDMLQT